MKIPSTGLRIGILVLAFPPRWIAGTEVATYNLARNLAERGHIVNVVTPGDEGLPRVTSERGFQAHRLGVPGRGWLRTPVYWVKAVIALRKLAPDIVHAQGVDAAVCALFARLLLRRPYVVWGRGSDVYTSWPCDRFIKRLIFSRASGVIALTDDMSTRIKTYYDGRVSVIPNAINPEMFRPEVFRTVQRQPDGRTGGKRVLFVGRLSKVKGVGYLIQAMRLVHQQDPTARLVLVGDGDERKNLEVLISEQNLTDVVTFVGRVSPEQVAEHMADSDVFVLPSLSEGFPGVVLEAMASGLPVVATRVTGMHEIVHEGENGFLVHPGDPGELASRVTQLLQDPGLRERISQRNRTDAAQYSWERLIERLESIYNSIAGAGRTALPRGKRAESRGLVTGK
jgi:glycosyltransferase involved in cell wall biosynthesis